MGADETSAQGYFVYAESYLNAARALVTAGGKWAHQDAPIRLLAFHSIESYFKAFLRCSGISSKDLAKKSRFGHDLAKLANESQSSGLNLGHQDFEVLRDARLSASSMQTRYLSPTAPDKLLVEVNLLIGIAARMRAALLSHPSRTGRIIAAGERRSD